MAAASTAEDLHAGAASRSTGTAAAGSMAIGGIVGAAETAAGTLVAITSAGCAATGAKPGA
jgi:hypothetical protein